MVVVQCTESHLKATEPEVENDVEWRYPCDDPTGAERGGAKCARDPRHGKMVDAFHASDVFDDSCSKGRVPQGGTVREYGKNA